VEGGCGDGVLQLQAGEQCDDDNLVSGDGCDPSCRSEAPD
jgi:cysteine-rich repeat protein